MNAVMKCSRSRTCTIFPNFVPNGGDDATAVMVDDN